MSSRIEKVNSVLRAAVGRQLGMTLNDPAFLATVTSVEVSPDLREADTWISVLPDTDEAWETVTGTLPELQRAVAEASTMKFTPRLRLRRDTGQAHAGRINNILRGLG